MTSHVFTTFDKKEYFLDEAEHRRLLTLGDKDFFVTKQGSQIRGSSINAIMPIEEYYRVNPDKRPITTKLLEAPQTPQIPLEKLAENNERHFRSLLIGLAKHAEEIGHTTHIFEQKKKRYKQIFKKDFILMPE